MKNTPWWSVMGRLALLGLAGSCAVHATTFETSHDAYYPEEDIVVTFRDGPGSSKDWVGFYLPDQVPGGGPTSTIWQYVDGTQTGATGYKEGTLTFSGGLTLAGEWASYFFLNDGYTKVATNMIQVVDPGTPLVRVGSRSYAPGNAISVTFTNGPANAKDWVGLYKAGQTPGSSTPSIIWAYVDGTQNGNTARADGTLTFTAGLTEPGDYVAIFLLNDGYDVISTERFRVVAASNLPRVLTVSPAPGASNLPPVLEFAATLTNGVTKLNPASIRLTLDGAAVTPEVVTANGLTTVRHASPALPAAGSSHAWVLTFADDATPPVTVRNEVAFAVGQYRNLVLPAPLYFENFDALAEGALPAGWTQKSYTTPINETEDFGDLGSLAYSRWTAVSADRFTGSLATYGNPEAVSTDYQRVLTPNPFNVVNGQALRGPLATGKFLFGNSGYQNSSSSQVLYLFTPDFDLTGKTNVHLAFKSLWEQNQDSIAAIEYSVDRGTTWLPIAYYLAAADIAKVPESEQIDAVATFTAEQTDVARYTDENGNEVGGTYGAFIAAPISESLASAIQARVDDNPRESKRVEFFALPQADRQATVRFRFAHAGADSWYFGIDDFGLYAISGETGPAPSLSVARDGAGIVLSWPADAAGYVLESSTGIGAAWQAVPGVTGNSYRATPGGTLGFYRLRK